MPDNRQKATFSTEDFGVIYNQVVMAIMNIDPGLSKDNKANYSLTAKETILNTTDKLKQGQYKIYPNPTQTTLTIEISSELVGSEMTIFNDIGVQIAKIILNELKTFIDIRHVSNGTYFCWLKGERIDETIKIVKY